jgi:outer membrane protein assembly factor BamB
VSVPRRWPAALKEEWRVPTGEGYSSSPVVAGGRVYVFTRHRDDEFLLCLDLAGGREVWRSRPYPAPYRVGPGEGSADDRPRSTPAVAGGRVYTLGMSGVLSCLDAANGRLLWRREFPAVAYGGSSPLVADGLCIAHVGDGRSGGLIAFDAVTGETRWRHADGCEPASGSPVLVTLAGERQVVTFDRWKLLGVSAATGRKLWESPSGHGPNITPLVYGDLLIVAAGDRLEPFRAVRLEKGDRGISAKEVWKANGHPPYYSSPVLAGDLLFGMSVSRRGSFFCLDARSGRTLWETGDGLTPSGPFGNASILSAGVVVLFLTDNGRLVVVRANATAYEPLAEYRVSDTATWAHPVFLGDRILIRDRFALLSYRTPRDGR